MTDRNGSLGRQAERVARSATDRRNLIWVMPAQGANTRFAGLGTLAYYASVPFFVRRPGVSRVVVSVIVGDEPLPAFGPLPSRGGIGPDHGGGHVA